MIFDPVIDSAYSDEEEIVRDPINSQPLMCAHCYKPIKGKYFQSGENFYDLYCWQFKFVIDPLYLERASKKTSESSDEDE
jgi:hypothetical protein